MNDLRVLALPHGAVALPAFLPDATQGTVRSLDATDVAACNTQAVMMNVFHLMQRPGSSTIRATGGLHRLFGWERPILTDSGGFQAYSLVRQNAKRGRLSDQGIVYHPEGSQRKINLTPEKSVQLQMAYDTDVVICLDDCTHVDATEGAQREAVRRTLLWAQRCKREYLRLLAQRRDDANRPRIWGVIQGGGLFELRRACAEALLEIGFDGYGLGGWPLDAQGNLLAEIIAYVRELVPRELPVHALGVGHPRSVVACARMGYELFDSAMPTRDARHGRLLVFEGGADAPLDESGDWFSYLYVQDERHVKDGRPVSELCDCLGCRRYSRAYLHQLFKTGDGLYTRLATLHNLRFMTQLMERLRKEQCVSEP